jgi:hypothetical protein
VKSGNIPAKATVKMDYFDCSDPPFERSDSEIKIIVRPHHTKSIDDLNNKYHPINLACKAEEIDCPCLSNEVSKSFYEIMDQSGIQPTLLWLDPRFLKTECLALLIAIWKEQLVAAQNVALGIVVPKGDTNQTDGTLYCLWKVGVSGISYADGLKVPVWYPSLARENKALYDASVDLDPYDVFPLVEFPNPSFQWGERIVTNHCRMLEQFRTRTRNFIYLNASYPDQAFEQFYGTLKAIPRTGSSVIEPVVTPGGSTNGFLTALLSGVLAESHFLTPREEIPMSSNAKTQGIIILRKCT